MRRMRVSDSQIERKGKEKGKEIEIEKCMTRTIEKQKGKD